MPDVAAHQPGSLPRRRGGSDEVPAIRCRTVLHGIAAKSALRMLRSTVRSRLRPLHARSIRGPIKRRKRTNESERFEAVARAEFGRRGYEATTVRDIAAAAGLSVGSVYRLDRLERRASWSQSCAPFSVKARLGWSGVLRSDGTAVEKLDALMWININAVVRFKDEFNIQLAWIRESPPTTTNLGSSFSARLGDLKSLLAQGIRSGELHVRRPDVRYPRLVVVRAPLDAREHRRQARAPWLPWTWPARSPARCGHPSDLVASPSAGGPGH